MKKQIFHFDGETKFYSGKVEDASAVEKLMLKAYTIHAVGKNAIAIALTLGLTSKEDTKKVSGVPHVQALML